MFILILLLGTKLVDTKAGIMNVESIVIFVLMFFAVIWFIASSSKKKVSEKIVEQSLKIQPRYPKRLARRLPSRYAAFEVKI